jgi:calcineurin-like phosphoesterase family protein
MKNIVKIYGTQLKKVGEKKRLIIEFQLNPEKLKFKNVSFNLTGLTHYFEKCNIFSINELAGREVVLIYYPKKYLAKNGIVYEFDDIYLFEFVVDGKVINFENKDLNLKEELK